MAVASITRCHARLCDRLIGVSVVENVMKDFQLRVSAFPSFEQ